MFPFFMEVCFIHHEEIAFVYIQFMIGYETLYWGFYPED